MRCIFLACFSFPFFVIAQIPFAIVELQDAPKPQSGQLLTEIVIKPKPLKRLCDYDQLLAEAVRQAKEAGANCLVIDKHDSPQSAVGCHRLEGRALLLEDPGPFEKEIYWHPDRKLTIADFRASTENRPATASTHCGFTIAYTNDRLTGAVLVTVSTEFYPRDSYFKVTEDSSYVLEHEQLHFDISEVYSRKFVKMAQEQVNTAGDWANEIHALYKSVYSEMIVRQDAYDAEVYAERQLQTVWDERISAELHALTAFDTPKFTIK